jgi:hypothetical protein
MARFETVFGPVDFRRWLDEMAGSIFGISGSEFLREYRAGKLADKPMAHYLAAVAPFLHSNKSRDS